MDKLFSVIRRNDGVIIWSQDQIKYIIDSYLKDFSTVSLAKSFTVSPATIRRLLKKNNIKVLSQSELKTRQFPRNSNFFETIDNNENAYWLGFLYADGYIHSNEIRINLKREDETHLQKFLSAIGAENNTIKYSEKIDGDKIYYQAYCHIRDIKMVNDLAKLGCVNNKSLILSFPTEEQVPQEYLSHFIRGYFDGDGSLSYSQSGRAQTPNYRINFVGTKDMIYHIRAFFQKDAVSFEDKGNYCSFTINGNKQLEKILDILYSNSNAKIELDRKRIIYNHYLLQRTGSELTNVRCEQTKD